ncbi:MAG: hypothetical protein KJ065_03420 [Anaerolineae bacterium]|nr:hypothetical protein [Anaerolineae bacterium]
MAAVQPPAVLDEILEFLAQGPSPQAIVDFKPSEALEQRLEYLLDRNRRDVISPEEQAELDEFLRMNHFMTMLQIRTRKKLLGK